MHTETERPNPSTHMLPLMLIAGSVILVCVCYLAGLVIWEKSKSMEYRMREAVLEATGHWPDVIKYQTMSKNDYGIVERSIYPFGGYAGPYVFLGNWNPAEQDLQNEGSIIFEEIKGENPERIYWPLEVVDIDLPPRGLHAKKNGKWVRSSREHGPAPK